MLLRMIELDMTIDKIIFCNTTLEYPPLYDYVKRFEKHINRKIIWVYPKTNFDHWFYGKYTRGKYKGRIRGFPWVVGHGWCCREFKVYPARDFKPDKDTIIYIGYAKGEEDRIQKDKNLKYPLIEWGWTEEKCLQYTKDKGIYNSLYDDFKRLGCWLCPKQRKDSLRILFEKYPKLWNKLLKYEKDSPQGFHPEYKLKDLDYMWRYQTKLK
jgi:3'-phosphoadenosine 5'-phosphosulfate sulfotransferase (PAPS reductase)/FAD synthetase